MPLFRLRCPGCKKLTLKIRDERPVPETCSCGAMPEFETRGSVSVKEVLDNGIMPRKVERFKDIEEMMRERSTEKKKDDIL